MQEIIRLDLGTVNCYLVSVKSGFILIDTGGYTFQGDPADNKCELLEKQLAENGCVPEKLLLILLTHGDIDHIANAKYLRDTYKAKVAIHNEDSILTTDLTVEKVLSNFKFDSAFLTFVSMLIKTLIKKATQKSIDSYTEFIADELIDEDYDLSHYNFDAKVIHLPGHTKGSIGLLTKDGNLISGDVFANIKKPGIALNAYDFPVLKKSIGKLKGLNIQMVYPGHGKPFRFSDLSKKIERY